MLLHTHTHTHTHTLMLIQPHVDSVTDECSKGWLGKFKCLIDTQLYDCIFLLWYLLQRWSRESQHELCKHLSLEDYKSCPHRDSQQLGSPNDAVYKNSIFPSNKQSSGTIVAHAQELKNSCTVKFRLSWLMTLLHPDAITNRSISPSPFNRWTDQTPSRRVPGQSPSRVAGNSQQTPRSTGTVACLLEQ